jgi:aminopeptidase
MSAKDGRVERYAELLLDTCLGVERGWQVIVWGTPWARPLLEELMKQLGERGAYPLLRLTFGGGTAYHRAWVRHAPLEVLAEPASIEVHAWEECDAWLGVQAPENTCDGVDITAERTSAVNEAYDRARSRLGVGDRVRPSRHRIPWVLCWYPTPALAQDAGMTLPAFADFLCDACLIDWNALHERISRHARLFDEAEEVRIVGNERDLQLSVAGRRAGVDAGAGNMPGASSSSVRLRRRPRARSHSRSSPRSGSAAR